ARLDTLDPNAPWQVLAANRAGAGASRPAGPPLKSWSIDPHAGPDEYRQLAVSIDALSPGLYRLTLSAPETNPEYRVVEVTRTALTIKRGSDSALVWATSMLNGQPVPGMALSLYDDQGGQIGRGQTDNQGILEAHLTTQPATLYVAATDSRDFAFAADTWQDGIEPWQWPELSHADGIAPAMSPTPTLSIRFDPNPAIGSKGQRMQFHIQTLDLRGGPVPRTALDYSIQHLVWNCGIEKDDRGRQLYRCAEKREAVAQGKLRTDAGGAYDLALTPAHGGEYMLTVQGQDARGNPVTGQHAVWVTAADENVSWPLEQARRIHLVADQANYSPGDTARLLVQSPYPRATALVTVERDQVLWHQVIALESNSALIAVPIQAAYTPNVYVSVVLIPPDATASFRVGYVELPVSLGNAATPSGASPIELQVHTASSMTLNARLPN
ncbi:MAG: hypothetical protein WCF84_26350, partial [Anaerolineae bacterium]